MHADWEIGDAVAPIKYGRRDAGKKVSYVGKGNEGVNEGVKSTFDCCKKIVTLPTFGNCDRTKTTI